MDNKIKSITEIKPETILPEKESVSSQVTSQSEETCQTSVTSSSYNDLKDLKKVSKPKKSKSENNKIKEEIRALFLGSTAQLVVKVLKTKNIFFKIFWCLIMVLCVTICVASAIRNVTAYLSYEIVTKIDTIYETQSQFPTLSFCNTATFTTSLEKIILHCQFNSNNDCFVNYKKYFEEFTDSIYGRCFRFNSGRTLSNESIGILHSTAGGIAYGLKIDLDIEMPQGYDFGELAISIHNHTSQKLNLFNREFYLSTGSYNIITIERVFNEKLAAPYGSCLKDCSFFAHNHSIINIIKEINLVYSQKDCLIICINQNILEKSNCGCLADIKEVQTKCVYQWFETSLNDTIKNCTRDFIEKFQKKDFSKICSKFCPLECDSIKFNLQSNKESILVDGPISDKSKDIYRLSNYKDYKEVKRRFISLNIFYEDLQYTHISQHAKCTELDLFAKLSSVFGFFIGFSFITFIELIEIFLEALFSLIFSNYYFKGK